MSDVTPIADKLLQWRECPLIANSYGSRAAAVGCSGWMRGCILPTGFASGSIGPGRFIWSGRRRLLLLCSGSRCPHRRPRRGTAEPVARPDRGVGAAASISPMRDPLRLPNAPSGRRVAIRATLGTAVERGFGRFHCMAASQVSLSQVSLAKSHFAGGATAAVWLLRLSASATKPEAFISSTKARK